jgi:hypothetical protein
MIKEMVSRLQLDVFGLAETRLNWNRYYLKEKFQKDMQRGFCNMVIEFASCSELMQGDWQPGGVCMGSCSRLSGQLVESGHDPTGMGRWCYQQFNTTNGANLTVIMVYQVCQTTAQGMGVNTAYMQQVRKLLETKREANPCKQMRADLSQFIVASREKGDSVALMWDANMTINDPEMVDTSTYLNQFYLMAEHKMLLNQGREDLTQRTRSKLQNILMYFEISYDIIIWLCGFRCCTWKLLEKQHLHPKNSSL